MTATANRLLVATFCTFFFHGIFLSYHFQQNRTLPTPLPTQRIVVSFGEKKAPLQEESIKKQPVVPEKIQAAVLPEPVVKKALKKIMTPEKIRPFRKKQLVIQKEEIEEREVETKAVSPPSKEQIVSHPPELSSATARVIDYATPLYRINPPPKYPRSARRRGLEGVVLLEAFVNIAGRVKELKLLKSSGYAMLDKAALKAVRDWSFSPGSVNGTPEEMRVRVPVRFRLN